MTLQEALVWGANELKKLPDHKEFAFLDAEILLSFSLGLPKEELLAHSEKKIPSKVLRRYKKFIARRNSHEPVAYITGLKEFYKLNFIQKRGVLIPRPETEMLVENAIAIAAKADEKTRIFDVGTGGGAIAIALALNISKVKIFASDINSSAVQLAKLNARRHQVQDRVIIKCGNLLLPHFKELQYKNVKNIIITANLPYLSTSHWRKTAPEIRLFEPRQALDGGSDGLKWHRELLKQLNSVKKLLLRKNLILLFEIDVHQKHSLPTLIKKYFPKAKCQIKKDIFSKPRLVIAKVCFSNK